MTQPTKLFNRNFVLISFASFLMFFAFYLVMPIIAMYVMEVFDASATTAGVVVSSYIITALLSRPFSGYLVDKYNRKKLYILTFSIFTLLFFGYIYSTSIPMLIFTRILLGAAFAVLTTASNTIAIDVLPAKNRAEGIGYFGALIIVSMALGPMVGLYLRDVMSYKGLFTVALLSCVVGTIIGSMVKTPDRPTCEPKAKLSLDRFFLFDALSMAIIMVLIYYFYGAINAYVSIYINDCGLSINSGNFFLLFAAGIMVARISSGRLLRLGLHNLLVLIGLACIILFGTLFSLLLTEITYPISSLLLGFGFGLVAPPVQAMVIDLVPHNKRGTANSTYFMALDLGSGMGMLTGGMIAHAGGGFETTYMVGVGFVVAATLLFTLFAKRDYAMRLKRAKGEN